MTRFQSLFRSATAAAESRFLAWGLAMMTRSHAGRRPCASRKLARICLLMRLRSTASAACLREIAKPSLGPSSERAATAMKFVTVSRLPFLKTRSNSAGLSRRARRGKRATPQQSRTMRICKRSDRTKRLRPASDGRGPWRDGGPEPCDHQRSPCGRGNHACAYDAASAAGRCVSLLDHRQQKRARIVSGAADNVQAPELGQPVDILGEGTIDCVAIRSRPDSRRPLEPGV